MFTEIAYIYLLLDPRDLSVRYVGKTVNPKVRLSCHLSECKNKKHLRANWIRSLLNRNLVPIFKIVKIVPLLDFIYWETFYISKYKSNKLTNSDDSGQGNINRKANIVERQSKKVSKVVYQFNLDGEYIDKYKSCRFAARELNLSHGNISKCCNGKFKHSGGFIFSYKSDKMDKVVNPNGLNKMIIEVNDFGDELNRWISIMDCSRSTGLDNGGLSRVCNGLLRTLKGRYFRFLKQ